MINITSKRELVSSSALLMMIMLPPVWAAETHTISVEADYWRGSTQVDNISRDSTNVPVTQLTLRHSVDYLPNVSVRRSSVAAEAISFDKTDITLFYPLWIEQQLHLEAGATVTRFDNSAYPLDNNQSQVGFDDWWFNGFADASLNIPNSQFDIFSRIDFGKSNGLKLADFIAGTQYRWPIRDGQLTAKLGYRVIDLQFTDFQADQRQAVNGSVLVNGVFVGAEYRF
ncbi:TIGR04219 family outer membrane beta-barrel protein [Vibrio sp.]|uniref:TIGR04219 family outer membrane beta-barrel protein n=1 Tax=Vibrio sp. TaxID=678 RepID=UPI003D10D3E7